ncbi:MAG: hypothetical protein HKP54_10225 [Boseongicola sp.]|nr:hypothetical protein [Boseongicola sp.]
MQEPTWQCVLICWGTKYTSAYINHTVEAVIRTSATKPRFILISDRPREGMHPDIQIVDFDPWFLNPRFLSGALHAKLSMFSKGVVPDDLPAIFLDLDTAVFGDVSQALKLMKDRKSMLMLQSVVLPFGWPGRLVYKLTNKKKYARGNSSMVVYHPAECTYIADEFRRLYEKYGDYSIRPMIGDERFISWIAQMHIERVPNWLAVKFLNEYMHTGKWLVYLKGALPWVQKRRDGLAAVTLPGDYIKPERLMEYKDGDALRADKDRWILWNKAALGNMGDRLHEYYQPLMEKLEAEKRSSDTL